MALMPLPDTSMSGLRQFVDRQFVDFRRKRLRKRYKMVKFERNLTKVKAKVQTKPLTKFCETTTPWVRLVDVVLPKT